MAAAFLLRLPPALKTALEAEAREQGVSLNTLIVTLLAGGIRWEGWPNA